MRAQDDALKQLATHCPYKLDEPKFTDPHTKVNVLLQSHFGRRDLSRELTSDLHDVPRAPRLQTFTSLHFPATSLHSTTHDSNLLPRPRQCPCSTPPLAARPAGVAGLQLPWCQVSVLNACLDACAPRRLPPRAGCARRGRVGQVLDKSTRLLQAMVDVLSSSGWLSPALAAMELCQMCVQGMWDRDPVLLQLPHVSMDLAKRAAEQGVEAIFDLMEMEDDDRIALLSMKPAQLADVANACNTYPNIEVRCPPSTLASCGACLAANGCLRLQRVVAAHCHGNGARAAAVWQRRAAAGRPSPTVRG